MARVSLQIRTVQLRDIPVLLMLLARQAELDQPLKFAKTSPQHLEYALFSPSGRMEVLLAELDQVPIGFLSFFHSHSGLADGLKPILRMDVLFVSNPHQHQEIGTALIQALAQIARAKGCHRIEWTFSVSQADCLTLYQALGARISATTRSAWLDRVTIERLSQPRR